VAGAGHSRRGQIGLHTGVRLERRAQCGAARVAIGMIATSVSSSSPARRWTCAASDRVGRTQRRCTACAGVANLHVSGRQARRPVLKSRGWLIRHLP
jgi:hypothetical protein